MRRVMLMLTVAVLMTAMMGTSASPARALNPQPIPPGKGALIERSFTGIQLVFTPSGRLLINDHFHPPNPCHEFCPTAPTVD